MEPGLYHSITDIVEAGNTSFKRDAITAKDVSQLESLEENSGDATASCCMLKYELIVSPFLNLFFQLRKIGYNQSKSCLIFLRISKTPSLVLELLILCFNLVVLPSKKIIEKNVCTCLHFRRGVQQIGDPSNDFSNSCQSKPGHSKKILTMLHFVRFK